MINNSFHVQHFVILYSNATKISTTFVYIISACSGVGVDWTVGGDLKTGKQIKKERKKKKEGFKHKALLYHRITG
jgi:hypothetical protein